MDRRKEFVTVTSRSELSQKYACSVAAAGAADVVAMMMLITVMYCVCVVNVLSLACCIGMMWLTFGNRSQRDTLPVHPVPAA